MDIDRDIYYRQYLGISLIFDRIICDEMYIRTHDYIRSCISLINVLYRPSSNPFCVIFGPVSIIQIIHFLKHVKNIHQTKNQVDWMMILK